MICNIDWLNVYCFERGVKGAAFFRLNTDYIVEPRDYGTRVFMEMFTLKDERGRALIEIRRNPMSSGVLPRDACHIRLSNYMCYGRRPIDFLRDFLIRFDYTFKSIQKIDLCCDFNFFDNGLAPNIFVEHYISGVFRKLYQSRIAAHGVNSGDGDLTFHSFSWGSKSSDIFTRFYCKSLELDANKPYIWQMWRDNGIDVTHPVWRVEFSMSRGVQKLTDGEHAVQQTLTTYDTQSKIAAVFLGLASHYFRFKDSRTASRIYNAKDVRLFPNVSALSVERNIPDDTDMPAKTIEGSFLGRAAQIWKTDGYDDVIRDLCGRIWERAKCIDPRAGLLRRFRPD